MHKTSGLGRKKAYLLLTAISEEYIFKSVKWRNIFLFRDIFDPWFAKWLSVDPVEYQRSDTLGKTGLQKVAMLRVA